LVVVRVISQVSSTSGSGPDSTPDGREGQQDYLICDQQPPTGASSLAQAAST